MPTSIPDFKTVAEATTWAADHLGQLSVDEQETFNRSVVSKFGRAALDKVKRGQSEVAPRRADTKRKVDATKTAATAATGSPAAGNLAAGAAMDTNKDGVVSPEEGKAAGASEEDLAAVAASLEEADAANMPGWIQSIFGGPLTPEQEAAALKALQAEGISITDLKKAQASPLAQVVLRDVAADTVSGADMTPVDIGGVKVPFNQLNAAQEAGLKVKDIRRLAVKAKGMGLTDAAGNPSWQILYMLEKSRGVKDAGASMERNPSAEEDRTANGSVRRHGSKDGGYNQPSYVEDGGIWGKAINPVKSAGVSQSIKGYKEGFEKYGTPSLAFLYALDSSLADRLITTARSGEVPDPKDIARARQLMASAGWDAQTLASLGVAASDLNSDLNDQAQAAADKKEKRPTVTAQMPDPASLREDMRSLWSRLFLGDPSEDQLADFTLEVQNAAFALARRQGDQQAAILEGTAGARGDRETDDYDIIESQSLDPAAMLQEYARGTNEYSTLYGNKPGGMSEEEYQSQFRSGAGSMLGSAAPDPNIIKAGMRSGDYNTSVGAAAMSPAAANNSSFLGRLARAAGVVADYT